MVYTRSGRGVSLNGTDLNLGAIEEKENMFGDDSSETEDENASDEDDAAACIQNFLRMVVDRAVYRRRLEMHRNLIWSRYRLSAFFAKISQRRKQRDNLIWARYRLNNFLKEFKEKRKKKALKVILLILFTYLF